MSEKFNDVPEMSIDGMDIWFRSSYSDRSRITFCTGDDSVDLTVEEARELRAFLDMAIPAPGKSEVQP